MNRECLPIYENCLANTQEYTLTVQVWYIINCSIFTCQDNLNLHMHVTTLFKEQAAQILQVDYNLTLINYKEEGFKTFVRAFYYILLKH